MVMQTKLHDPGIMEIRVFLFGKLVLLRGLYSMYVMLVSLFGRGVRTNSSLVPY